ncbi:CRC domain-containing protein TSO1-like isoform X2 [Punica granatum]|uniref:CRC domain-containing protein TSO1-like isoform X2 n=1 Tax=Punica granatum TaxID=22663 RepID=A0A6P8EGK9_PUNGR|nr:CRC domain-containing protein TSO1-like isoform X2 [Punica granatum]
MDTPGKSHDALISSASASASASNFEDSPVFHYISSLSPLELVKTYGTNQSFSLLSSASPLAVFTSPRIDTHKEHPKFQSGRHHLSGSLIHSFSETDNNPSVRVLKPVEKLDAAGGKSGTQAVISAGRHDIVLTDHDVANQVAIHSTAAQGQEDARRIVSSNPFVEGIDVCERNLRKICHAKQSQEDLMTLVPAADSDVMTFESSIFIGDEIVSTTDIIHNPDISAHEEPGLVSAGLADPYVESKLEQELALSALVPSHAVVHELAVSDSSAELDERNEIVARSYSKQSALLRRCLFSEMATTNRNSTGSSMSISDIGNVVRWDSETSDLPLPLTSSCGAASASGYLMSGDVSIVGYSDVDKIFSQGNDLVPCDDEALQTEDDRRISGLVCKDLDQCCPLMKRSKFEDDMEIASCKRCNCRRSKCLKLYCDCFAAGLYCIEPCSCQDCFNRPIYKDKVLETRRHIESRNPLAFAPRVVRDTDSYMEGEEQGTKTPVSARHKQGCRCKRSSCLKKYCECFQAGVGCSFNCRCEGCKNAYGHKDELRVLQQRDIEAHEKVRSDMVSKYDDSEEEQHADLLKRPTTRDRVWVTFLKSQIGTSLLNDGAPRTCSTRNLETLCTFPDKHKFEKQEKMTADAENRDINRGSPSGDYPPPATLKHSSPIGSGVSHSTPRSRYASSTAMRSSRRRVILKSITSFESPDS